MRNEQGAVGACLDSFLRNATGETDVEILCVDGMSTDSTREIVQQRQQQDERIRLIENPRKIVPTGLNLAIRQSRGDFIMVVGCHAEYATDYIQRCLNVIARTGADHVGGYMTTLAGDATAPATAIAAATSSMFGVGNSSFRLSGPEREADTVPFGMYRREVFEKIGLYDERLVRNQDIELNWRLRKAGGRIIISPEIKLSYYNRATFRGLWQQAFNNGLWNPYTVWLTGGGLSLRHFVPMFFVFGLTGLAVGAFFWSPLRWVLLGYVLTYLLGACAFAARASRAQRVSMVLVLWSFIVLHTAYGLGSLWSVLTIPFKFSNRHKEHIGEPLADRVK
jgi:glycosyltransferase involved in cell wall biosynthesis